MVKPCRECSAPIPSAIDQCPHCGAYLPGRPMSVGRIADPFDYTPFVTALATDTRIRVRVDLAGLVAAVSAARHITGPRKPPLRALR